MEIGYFLSSEEHSPLDLVQQATMAADVGMESVWISDHYHPWLDEQGHSPLYGYGRPDPARALQLARPRTPRRPTPIR